MIVEFTDSVAGTAVYINPAYVVTLRPDPESPLNVTNGAPIRVRGEHREVANKLAET